MTDLIIPQEYVNDEHVLLVSFTVANGEPVMIGQKLAEIETSKSMVELYAPCKGFFFYRAESGARLPIGGLVGVISENSTDSAPTKVPDSAGIPAIPKPGLPTFTKPALALLEQYALDAESFAPMSLVTKEDVMKRLSERAKSTGEIPNNPTALHLHRNTDLSSLASGRAKVLIIGGSGHGAVVGEILLTDPRCDFLGYSDSIPSNLDKEVIPNRKVVCLQSDLVERFPPNEFALTIAIGENDARAGVADEFAAHGYSFVTAVHRAAVVSPSARLGAGVVVMPGAIVGPRTLVGDHAIINTGASVDHDCRIGRNAHIAPGAHLGGYVKVGDFALVGIGVCINRRVSVGRGATIASGFSLYRDVPEGMSLTPKRAPLWW